MARISNPILTAARCFTVLLSAASLGVYTPILLEVTSDHWVSVQTIFTALPLIPLSVAILWNLNLILLAFTKLNISKWVSICDLTIAIGLVTCGTMGFVHDDSAYYGDGLWQQYSMGGNMIHMEIAAFTCLTVAALVFISLRVCSVLILVSILEVIIATLVFWRFGERTRVDRGLKSEDILPTYDQVKGSVEVDGKSLSSYEGSFENEKKEKISEKYQ
jgi:hypothetical protein